MIVKPAPGLKVRDPVKKDFLPDEGRKVSATDLYWNRRLSDGDVILVAEKTDIDAAPIVAQIASAAVPVAAIPSSVAPAAAVPLANASPAAAAGGSKA
jgi:hypothetical protein